MRLLGIRFGLPFHHHWDEGWVVNSAAAMLRNGNDVPESYQYGAPLSELGAAGLWLLRRWRHVAGDLGPEDVQVRLYVITRAVTALVSASGTLACYVAAAACAPPGGRDPRVRGAVAALLYAGAHELVLHSRFAVTDACLVGLTAWTLAVTAQYVRTRRLVWAVAGLGAAGLTVAFKPTGLLTAAIPVAALLTVRVVPANRVRSLAHRAILIGAIPVVLLVYVALNRHVVDHAPDAARDILARVRQTRNGGASAVYLRAPGLPHLISAIWVITTEFLHRTPAVASALAAVSGAGLLAALRRGDRVVAIAVLHATLATLAMALPNRVFWVRNYLVVTPCMCVGFGLGCDVLARRVSRIRAPWWRGAASAAGVLGIFFALVYGPLVDAIRCRELEVDPRSLALAWIRNQVTSGKEARVATTKTAFADPGPGVYDGLQALVPHPGVRLVATDLEACPSPRGPVEYVLVASRLDPHKHSSGDPYAPVWPFESCPGFVERARFAPNPYEYSASMPNWNGKVWTRVLARP